MMKTKIVIFLLVLLLAIYPVYGASSSSGGWTLSWVAADLTNSTIYGMLMGDYINQSVHTTSLNGCNASLVPNQITPIYSYTATCGNYSDLGTGNNFHSSSFVVNDGTRPTVAVFGEGLADGGTDSQAWGGNFVGYGRSVGSTGIGAELNYGCLVPGGCSAYGLIIASAGNNSATQAIHIASNTVASQAAVGIAFSNQSNINPINSSGSLMQTQNNVTVAYGIDFRNGTFMNATVASNGTIRTTFLQVVDRVDDGISTQTARMVFSSPSNPTNPSNSGSAIAFIPKGDDSVATIYGTNHSQLGTMWRINNDGSAAFRNLTVYNGTSQVNVFQTQIEEEFTGNGAATYFNTTYYPIVTNSTKVTNSTQRVRYGSGAGKYTANSTGIIFGTAPANGESILVDYVV